MKYIKKFEDNYTHVEVGDYVILNTKYNGNSNKELDKYYYFLRHNIGKVLSYKWKGLFNVLVGYEDIPEDILEFLPKDTVIVPNKTYYTQWFSDKVILYYAKSLEELETKIESEKYNL